MWGEREQGWIEGGGGERRIWRWREREKDGELTHEVDY